ncbi:transcriptional regulator [Spirochaetia bacterium 38H-sp]|uniref:Transcriptional regulator n=1 Tax=Rarispira pelagica TaxID=3141764 RepID=A0ABU9UCY4_9SPIR
MNDFIRERAKRDFEKARMQEFIDRITGIFNPQATELLSLDDVKEIIKPRGEKYLGIKTVEIDKIVGSEGRYLDFNKKFLPKHSITRNRWESIDSAHLKYKELPPVKLYEVGGVYFVRDGNHRISVAKSRDAKFIDAEVTSLNSHIEITPDMTINDIIKKVIEYEYKDFKKKTRLKEILPDVDIYFSTPGRYDELYEHILVHKYYINMDKDYEIPFEEALISWYKNVYKPIIDIIREEDILDMFPDRTEGDLYIWSVRHWDDLKRQYGQNYDLKDAVTKFAREHGSSGNKPLKKFFKTILSPFLAIKKFFTNQNK